MNRRLAPDLRRQQIIAAARTVIVERGLAATSLRDIAAAAQVSVGTVTYHFVGVDEILSAVVITESESFYAKVVQAADSEPDPRRAMLILIDSLFGDPDKTSEHWKIWADYWAATARRPEIADAYADRIRHWQNCLERVIARGVSDSTFRSVDPNATALKMAAYSDGLGIQMSQQVTGLDHRTAHRWLVDFAELLLGPVSRPAPG
ncbi:TetR/AcrR family transcriptional regulator [Naumannella halotolerans]|uniref:AcrR family transcriptional regulator n=1 Tax=Naumannella halotolerans TaxID=993414 RepID=A0A4V3EMU8_9ACTN|nr:TetR/AcrR family transcriptional regulator [Naumannella halotolerans]TDT31368.1 AcrR family transcriptional regulator [Naumannella halotolerans]